MPRTRLSLWYVAAYLWLGGAALLFAPNLAARLLLSNTDYPAVMLQSAGMFMVGLGIIVVQIIRRNVSALYPATLAARLFICACLLYFHVTTGDPLFLVLFGIVALGVVLTGASYLQEGKA